MALQEGFLKSDWKRSEAVISWLETVKNQSGLNCGGTDVMSVTSVGEREATGGRRMFSEGEVRGEQKEEGVEEQKVPGGESPPPTLSQTHAWLLSHWLWLLFKQGWQLPQTSPCLIWHTFTLTCTEAPPHAVPFYGTLLSSFLLLGLIRLRSLWLPSGRSTVWRLNHSSNQDVPSSLVMKYHTDQALMPLIIPLFSPQIYVASEIFNKSGGNVTRKGSGCWYFQKY